MPKEGTRARRVGDLLRRELAQLIQLEMRDPRVGMVMVNDVEVSRDLSFAKVYVTAIGRESNRYCENLVASPKHRGKTPVAKGSRLPV